MAAAAKLEVVPEVGTDIVVAVAQNPGLVLLDSEKFDAFYTRMKVETDKLVPDTSTTKGRDEIRAVAARVVRAKTSIDKARLTLTKEWRDNTKLANDAGKVIEERLEALADEVRKPLTDWEAAEEAREVAAKALIDGIWAACEISIEDTAAEVRQRGTEVWNTVLDADVLGARLDEAQSAKGIAVERLKVGLARLTKEESDRAELEKLRAAEAERARVEEEKAAAAEIERKIAEAARAEEQRKAEAEKAEADKIAVAREEAALAAQREAEARHAAEIAAERAKLVEAERLAQVERDRVAQIEAEREATKRAEEAAAQKLADEQAERERNKAHRGRVKTAAKQAIMTCGADEETAQKIVLAMIAGEIPNASLDFKS